MVFHDGAGGIDYKITPDEDSQRGSGGGSGAFPNLFVKQCDEIIALGCPPHELSWRQGAEVREPSY